MASEAMNPAVALVPSHVVVPVTLPGSQGVPTQVAPPSKSWKQVCEDDAANDRLFLNPAMFTGKVKICFGDGPSRRPCISFDKSILEALASTWKSSLLLVKGLSDKVPQSL